MSYTIAVDFDGVLHSYISPFSEIPMDPPVPGAINWLKELVKSDLKVAILSTRNSSENGPEAVRKWLKDNGLTDSEIATITFPKDKIRATLYIDDRGYNFKGDNFPSIEFMTNYRTWNRELRDSAKSLKENASYLKGKGVSLKDIARLLKDS